jgi:hypothetical protein
MLPAIQIQVPLGLDNEYFLKNLAIQNPHLQLGFENGILEIQGRKQRLENLDFFCLNMPFKGTIDDIFIDNFTESNTHIKPEFILPDKIIINMLTPEMIAAFSALIVTGLVLWNRTGKKGRVYDGTARYDIEVSNNSTIEKQKRAPDFSYIAFEKLAKEKLNQAIYIQGSPTFCGEILSQKHQLKANLDKMRDVWMAAGTDLCIVVCPYRKKYYVFDPSLHYKIVDFSQSFKNDLLPGLEINFSSLLDEVND